MSNHVASKCLKVTNAAPRKQSLRRKILCFICFKSDHLANSCNSKHKCHKCNGRHHISISTFEKSDDSSDQNNGQLDGATATNFSNNSNNILLQTATAVVSNTNNSEKLTTNLILDSGSQRSYISSESRHKLNLPKIRTERLLIKTFGNTNFKYQNVDIVPLNVRKVSCNYYNLKRLKLVDSPDKEIKNIEILIGLDYYYQIVRPRIHVGMDEMYEIVHQAMYRFFGIDEMYKLVMDEM